MNEDVRDRHSDSGRGSGQGAGQGADRAKVAVSVRDGRVAGGGVNVSGMPNTASMSERPTAGIAAEVAGFDAAWDTAVAQAGLSDSGWDVDAVFSVVSDSAVMDLMDHVGALGRHVDALRTRLATSVADRSRVEHGNEGLARKHGYTGTGPLLSDMLGITTGQARQLDQVAAATKPRQALTGGQLPAKHPHLAEAVRAGTVGVLTADVIVHTLDSLHGTTPDSVDQAEQILVEAAATVNLTTLRRLCIEVRDRFDPDGVEPRTEAHYRRRSLVISTRDGMTHIEWDLPTEDAAIVVTGIDAVITKQLRGPRDTLNGPRDTLNGEPAELSTGKSQNESGTGGSQNASNGDPLLEHPEPHAPSMAQLRSDAAVAMFQHATDCTNTDTIGTSHTVVVRMSVDQLRDEIGAVTLDGINETIPAAAARRIACTAGIIPIVLDGESQPLDVGREKRYFEGALRTALAERDRGCAWPGCAAPPSWCDAHHIQWWATSNGPTSLENGVLLCRRHHRLVHEGEWKIEAHPHDPKSEAPGPESPAHRPDSGASGPKPPRSHPPDSKPGRYLIPPRHIDPSQFPRPMKMPKIPESIRKRE